MIPEGHDDLVRSKFLAELLTKMSEGGWPPGSVESLRHRATSLGVFVKRTYEPVEPF